MKKIILFVLILMFSVGTLTVLGATTDRKNAPDKPAVPNKTENKLSEEEMSRLTNRVEEIRDMDKTTMTVKEKRELKNELKAIKKTVNNDGGYVYIGTAALILIIILIVVLI